MVGTLHSCSSPCWLGTIHQKSIGERKALLLGHGWIKHMLIISLKVEAGAYLQTPCISLPVLFAPCCFPKLTSKYCHLTDVVSTNNPTPFTQQVSTKDVVPFHCVSSVPFGSQDSSFLSSFSLGRLACSFILCLSVTNFSGGC